MTRRTDASTSMAGIVDRVFFSDGVRSEVI
jgi:hypothetical protein